MVSWPRECDRCHPADRELYGCGFVGAEGKAANAYTQGATEEPYNRTCPRWYWQQPAVQDLLALVRDYERAALGNIDDMEAPLIEYLRAAEAERKAWESENERQLMDQH